MTNDTAAKIFGDKVIKFRVHVGSRNSIKLSFPDMKSGSTELMGLVIIKKTSPIFFQPERRDDYTVEVLVKHNSETTRIPFGWVNLNTVELVSESDHIIFKLEVEDLY